MLEIKTPNGVTTPDERTWLRCWRGQAYIVRSVDDALRVEVEGLLESRTAARAAKDWPEADRIRDRLNALNVVVMDGPDGPTWRMKN